MTGAGRLVGAAEIDLARNLLSLVAVRTPALRCEWLEEETGAEVWLKTEGLQVTNSFKFRGAYVAVTQAVQAGAKAVVAYSSGNHGGAVAAAAAWHGVPATVLMPSDAPDFKVARVLRYGGTVRRYDRYRDDRYRMADDLAACTGAVVVPSADSPHIIAGAATIAAELVEQAGGLDAVVVPVGGGGLLAGTCCAVPARTHVIGVEPEGSDDLARSLQAGRRVEVPVGRSVADGLLLGSIAPTAWQIVRERVTSVVVSEGAILDAVHRATEETGLVLEPSAAAAVAGLLHMRDDLRGARVGVVVTGANVGWRRLGALLTSSDAVSAATG